jgi:serine protease Do
MIGEPVIAVGNPLGFSHSVSTGIVSAIHRDLSTANPQMKGMTDLVQTDAAINPGNSGGPLLNAYGQVIGINTAIRGDAQNIGFAIQSSTLRDMIPALLNPAQAAKLDIPATLAERRTVKPPSTIEAKVELCESEKRYVITEINGHQPKDIVDAYAMVLACKPGDEITFKLEGGETRKIKVKPAAVPEVVKTVRTKLGITVEELTPMLAEKHGLPVDEGILVTEVQEGSRAQTAGLQAGDVIVQIGVPVQRYLLINPVTKLDKLGIIVQRLPASGVIQLGVHRGNESGTINLNLGSPKRDSI